MKRGLVIGKFMPIHLGHIALIKFAASMCDELIVSMSYTPHDPIPANLRFNWLTEIFNDHPVVKPFLVEDDFDTENLPLTERTRIWAEFISRTYPPIDVLISSEEYGIPFAQHLKAVHLLFDPDREQIPVSATLIRSEPFKYWNFIPTQVRPYFVKKICLYGAESTGKSTLTLQLAERYNTTSVPEVAREFLTSNDFTVDDIIKIGHAQIDRIKEKVRIANKVLFCDTDTITTQIYSNHYLKTIPKVLYSLEKEITYDHYFLLDIDVGWVADGLRDLGDRREEMMNTFRAALEERSIPYTLVSGNWQQRLDTIEKVLVDRFNLPKPNLNIP